MRITALEPAKKSGKHRLYTEEGFLCTLEDEVIAAHHIHAGAEVDSELLNALDFSSQCCRAKQKAYYLLGYRDHTRKELFDKLCRTVSPQAAEWVCNLLEEQRYLNDEACAQKLAAYYVRTKKMGQRRAVYELLRRGINEEMARQAILSIGADPVMQICEIIFKKYTHLLDGDYKNRSKLVAALVRRGYSFDDVRAAIDRYPEWEEEQEE